MGVAIYDEWNFCVVQALNEFEFGVWVAQPFFIYGPGVYFYKIIVVGAGLHNLESFIVEPIFKGPEFAGFCRV